MQAFLSTAPPELAGPLHQMVANHNQQHAALVQSIVANSNNVYTAQELAGKPMAELQKLQSLINNSQPATQAPNVPQPLFTGAAAGATLNSAPAEVPVLERPTMNFGTDADEE